MSSYQQLNVAPNPSNANTGAYFLPGMMSLWGGATAPADWLLCDGTAISRSTYANLFAAIGTTFGAGNGTTTFNVPNTAGRTVRGVGTASWTGLNSGAAGTTAVTLGASAGADGTKQSADNLPQHTHKTLGPTNSSREGALLFSSTGLGLGSTPAGNFIQANAVLQQTDPDGTQTNTASSPALTTNSNTLTTNAYIGINYIIKT